MKIMKQCADCGETKDKSEFAIIDGKRFDVCDTCCDKLDEENDVVEEYNDDSDEFNEED